MVYYNSQIKYSLTQQDEHKDKETIHLEFDLTGSGISWISGKYFWMEFNLV